MGFKSLNIKPTGLLFLNTLIFDLKLKKMVFHFSNVALGSLVLGLLRPASHYYEFETPVVISPKSHELIYSPKFANPSKQLAHKKLGKKLSHNEAVQKMLMKLTPAGV